MQHFNICSHQQSLRIFYRMRTHRPRNPLLAESCSSLHLDHPSPDYPRGSHGVSACSILLCLWNCEVQERKKYHAGDKASSHRHNYLHTFGHNGNNSGLIHEPTFYVPPTVQRELGGKCRLCCDDFRGLEIEAK
ncbi:unnamed protein product [Clavelina lepadiformis]|uniref:Uncharacterized protein n=1 Tax=Clavelina lepadiformis TaxID=159417 RepID=A0ABP0GZU3_CLALP